MAIDRQKLLQDARTAIAGAEGEALSNMGGRAKHPNFDISSTLNQKLSRLEAAVAYSTTDEKVLEEYGAFVTSVSTLLGKAPKAKARLDQILKDQKKAYPEHAKTFKKIEKSASDEVRIWKREKAIAWFKRNWYWVLLGSGTVGGLITYGYLQGKSDE